jgi:hypothetical protein
VLRDSISRDRRLLRGRLTESDRAIVEKRPLEQRLAFDKLLASTFPTVFQTPTPSRPSEPTPRRQRHLKPWFVKNLDFRKGRCPKAGLASIWNNRGPEPANQKAEVIAAGDAFQSVIKNDLTGAGAFEGFSKLASTTSLPVWVGSRLAVQNADHATASPVHLPHQRTRNCQRGLDTGGRAAPYAYPSRARSALFRMGLEPEYGRHRCSCRSIKKKGPPANARGPSLGRKRPRRAAIAWLPLPSRYERAGRVQGFG